MIGHKNRGVNRNLGKKPGGKKAWWKESLLEKKPGGKNGSGKKWKENLVEGKPGLFWKRWKKALCLFLGLKHIKINDEVKLTDYFNRLPF